MEQIQTLFLTVISDFFHGRETVVTDRDVDWELLYRCGRRHHLTALLYDQLRSQIPGDMGEQFRSDYMAQVVQANQRRHLTRSLTEILEETVSDYFYIKGDEVARLYSHPAMRSMSDVDVMVHRADMEPLAQALQAAGFVLEEQGVGVWAYTKEGIAFEVHSALIESTHREDDAAAAFTERCWDYVRDRKLDWSFHMIYLLLHLRKHFRARGVGFRQFLDVAFVAREISLDWDFIRREMEALNLWRFTLTVLALCRQWFGSGFVPQPVALDPEFVALATDAVFANGVFGFGNEVNKDNELINTGRSEGVAGLLGKTWRVLFPTYREMYETEQYAFVEGRPWLLPVAWVYRIAVVSREGKLGNMLKDLFRLPEKTRRRAEIYDKWGL